MFLAFEAACSVLVSNRSRPDFETNSNPSTMLILSVSDEAERSGNVSPRTPSPRSEVRGIRLFRMISRKLARRSQEDFHSSDESRSSSSESSSCSTSIGHHHTSRIENSSGSNSSSSSSSSESGSDVQMLRSRHHHSTSAESLRKVFQNLNLYSRSQSCANAKEIQKKKKEKKAPKSILRHPTSYTYARGLSGLPTQRIPRYQTRSYNACSCSMHYLNSLNR